MYRRKFGVASPFLACYCYYLPSSRRRSFIHTLNTGFHTKKNNNSKHRQFLNFLSLTQWIVLECSLICVFKPCSSQASLLWHLSTPHNHMNLHWQIFISHLCWIVRTKNEKLAEKWKMVRTFHCFEVRTTISTGIRTYFAHELLDWFLSPTQFSQKKLVSSWNWFALSQKLGSEPRLWFGKHWDPNHSIVLRWILIG